MYPSILLLCALVAPLLFQAAGATPHIPPRGDQVLERLPARTDPVQRELLRLRASLSANPADMRLATTLARRYIEQARHEGDPRYLGYAQAALAPWWARPEPPAPVLVLRATLRQSTHQFRAALRDLDLLVKRDSDDAQAWLTRATVQQVIGEHDAAWASCMRLYSRAPELVVQTCLAAVGSVSGQGRASYDRLRQALAERPDAPAPIRVWVETLLAEMAARLGDAAAAERHFRAALALDAEDSYLIGAWADFLLDAGRAGEAARLLQDRTRADALLLPLRDCPEKAGRRRCGAPGRRAGRPFRRRRTARRHRPPARAGPFRTGRARRRRGCRTPGQAELGRPEGAGRPAYPGRGGAGIKRS
ncbi:hypothetical protein [Massilia sp. Dwa41.01b]|uniref:hypothetical protein n=1 Tax=Massilia sp. Dwa41.01b TaxID=2709302 RepID=UPI001E3A3520|nr:hypothetical protein [Massilia sp. Dwa41.01b]